MGSGYLGSGIEACIWLWLLLTSLAAAQRNFAVPWSSTTYGPDGPWQAIKVQVGGNRPDERIDLQSSEVDLYPGGTYTSYILTPAACKPFVDRGSCGKGGMWDANPRDSSYEISWTASFEDAPINQTSGGCKFNIQAITINEWTAWNASLVAVDNVTVTMANGQTWGPLLGRLALGGEKTIQQFTKSNKGRGTFNASIYPGALYDQGRIPSYSYGLHIGSVAHAYTGSLVFGGYDKGRVIGPYTTFPDDTINLLDIGIGVETGGSPFPFETKQGLLKNKSKHVPLDVMPDPTVPYLHLPGGTCEAIAKLLPVTMDSETGYYMWDTDDPLFQRITSSPAYLGFTFPPASGKKDNIIIKVPFALLNLTLDSPIINSPRPYFPCSSFTPGDGDYYRLGRTFLQAAFIGRNWPAKVSWLAQAPGPGVQGEGLGVTLQDIPDRATTIDYFDPTGQFAYSWSKHWKALAGTKPAPPKATESAHTASGLSPAAKAGIGAGSGVAGLLALGALAFFVASRRRSKTKMGATGAHAEEPKRSLELVSPTLPMDNPPLCEAEHNPVVYELANSQVSSHQAST